jgi:hypothetical protein
MLVEASVEGACKDTAAWNPFWQPLAAKLITASNGGNNRYFREWLATAGYPGYPSALTLTDQQCYRPTGPKKRR